MTTHPATIQAVHQGPALVVALCGARWNGVQQGRQPEHALAMFTDPVTKSTLSLPLGEVTIGAVWRALAAKREQYRAAMQEPR